MLTESRESSTPALCTETEKAVRSSTGWTRLSPPGNERGRLGGVVGVYINHASYHIPCRWLQAYKNNNPPLDRPALVALLEAVRSLPEAKRVFCHTCSQLIPSSAVSPDHTSHQLRYGVEDSLLTQPTRLLTPRDNKKSNAVSFFRYTGGGGGGGGVNADTSVLKQSGLSVYLGGSI